VSVLVRHWTVVKSGLGFEPEIKIDESGRRIAVEWYMRSLSEAVRPVRFHLDPGEAL
jgi:hypothetical protein